ncbi:hypothetical protein IWX86_001082 [Polaromonas sp. CG_9.2]|nr:hypothetical protein [Polaromonas sp. CG_9.2]
MTFFFARKESYPPPGRRSTPKNSREARKKEPSPAHRASRIAHRASHRIASHRIAKQSKAKQSKARTTPNNGKAVDLQQGK